MPPQAIGKAVRGRRSRIEQSDGADPCRRQRGGDRGTDAAAPHDQRARAGELEALALHAADESRAVEHVAHEAAIGPAQDGVARSGDARGGGDLVHQFHRRDLVRHRDECPAEIRELEQTREHLRIVLGLDAHRHHHGIDALLLEIRVVDHRRLEGVGRVADVRDEGGRAANHGFVSRQSEDKSTACPVFAACAIPSATRRFARPSRAVTSGGASPRTTAPKCSS